MSVGQFPLTGEIPDTTMPMTATAPAEENLPLNIVSQIRKQLEEKGLAAPTPEQPKPQETPAIDEAVKREYLLNLCRIGSGHFEGLDDIALLSVANMFQLDNFKLRNIKTWNEVNSE